MVQDTHASILGAVLLRNHNLVDLYLTGNMIGDDGATFPPPRPTCVWHAHKARARTPTRMSSCDVERAARNRRRGGQCAYDVRAAARLSRCSNHALQERRRSRSGSSRA